jgi:spore maturation protein CgeB
MKIYLFYHSVISDWNHGNAHFLRGVVSSFMEQGNDVVVYEPMNGWSLQNLIDGYGKNVINEFNDRFPSHKSVFYDPQNFNPYKVLTDADLVIVHEWNEPELIRVIGEYRSQHSHFRLFFHDTHHRSVTKPEEMQAYDLHYYDGVLVFGDVIRKIYLEQGWAKNVYTWHEAADTRVFQPDLETAIEGDLVWIGNWGDDERTEELTEFIIEPVKELNLKAVFYGVRYPDFAIELLKKAGIEYRGWLPNHKVPEVFAKYRLTVHVPRRPYVRNLPGIPTIRPFEAMACGIPLLSSWWYDSENLFNPGKDFLMAKTGNEMKDLMTLVLRDPHTAASLGLSGIETIHDRHTCNHRVKELFTILEEISQKEDVLN